MIHWIPRVVITSVLLLVLASPSVWANAITCGDVMDVGLEARMTLHASAQKRAQIDIESFIEKKLKKPYVDAFGKEAQPENMAAVIEVFWCETQETPLHSAYYRFYSSNKKLFQ